MANENNKFIGVYAIKKLEHNKYSFHKPNFHEDSGKQYDLRGLAMLITKFKPQIIFKNHEKFKAEDARYDLYSFLQKEALEYEPVHAKFIFK